MTNEEWLAARRLGVSGTDIGVLLGVNPYKTADDLVLDKLGVGKGFAGNAATRAGQRLEPLVASAWSRRNQRIITPGEFTIHPDNTRFIGTTDFLTTDSVLEIKTGAIHTWKNGLPNMYECQLRWYMYITGRTLGNIVCCIVPKDRSEIPNLPDEDLLRWVDLQPHREYQLDWNQDWVDRAEQVALQFLDRMDQLHEDGRGLLMPTQGKLPTFEQYETEAAQQKLRLARQASQ